MNRIAIAVAGLIMACPMVSHAKAYLIADVQVTDDAKFKAYGALVPATLTEFGGAFLVRLVPAVVLEGAPPAGRTVVLEFPNAERARAWYESPAYQALISMRKESSTARLFIVDGIAPP